MPYTLNDLGKTLINQLYDIVCGGDGSIPPAKDTFITWCHPGLAFEPRDFDFCAKGLGTGKDAEAEKRLVNQAFNFAELVNFIPNVQAAYTYDRQQGMFDTDSQARLSTMYGEILRSSKVVHTELTDKEKAKIEKFRNLLRTTKKVTDIITDEEKEVTEDGPMLKAYYDKQSGYIDAALQYNMKRVAAMSATGVDGKQAVFDWTSNAELYRMQVKSAKDAWISGGYRNEVDQISAYIDQVGRRDMTLWKQNLVELFDEAVINGLAQGQRFYYTAPIPASFATSKGWNGYTVSHETVDSKTHSESKSWKVGGGVHFGLFSVGGGAKGKSSKYNENFAMNKFKLSFQLTQVVLSRPYFYPEFFLNQGWTLRPGEGWNFAEMPSNGGDPPKGLFVGYPTTALFARNIRIESAEFASAYSAYSSEVGGEASIGYGPFSLSGGYASASRDTHFHSEADSKGLTVPGMQIIGFVNHLLGKTPNPLPQLKPEQFV